MADRNEQVVPRDLSRQSARSASGNRNFYGIQLSRMLRFLTAGESHGQALVMTLDGMPAGLSIDVDALNAQLRRRQGGYGRGRRMQIESDRAEILAGVRHGRTTGAPIALLIRNRDWVNWQQTMYVEREQPEGAGGARRGDVTRPRPGHADLAGAIKYGHTDIRDVLERASARETAARVAAGTLARQLLGRFGISVASHVTAIGDVLLPTGRTVSFAEAHAQPDDSPLRCVDPQVQGRMITAIDAAREAGDTLGGAFEVIATGVPPGLGSYVQWDRKLDGRLAQAVACIHAIKAVGIGIGPEVALRPGSRVHDEIVPPPAPESPPGRPSNNAGGLEGGVTNGQDVRVTGFMKPIATLMKPLRSVDLTTLTEAPAAIERSDVCAVPAAAVVGEAMVAFVLADAFLEKFGGDSIEEIERHYAATAEQVRRRFSTAAAAASAPAPGR
jgi:chorismate synthase